MLRFSLPDGITHRTKTVRYKRSSTSIEVPNAPFEKQYFPAIRRVSAYRNIRECRRNEYLAAPKRACQIATFREFLYKRFLWVHEDISRRNKELFARVPISNVRTIQMLTRIGLLYPWVPKSMCTFFVQVPVCID